MPDQMYKPMPRSPMTTLYQGIDSTQTTITVADASKLPDAPNKATIGGGDDSETVMYTGKSGNDLTGCTRGFDPAGSAKAWDSGSPVARVWTSQDLEAVQDNLVALDGHDNTLHSETYITDTQVHGNEKHSPDYIPATEKGANDGVATLDAGGDVPASQLGNVDQMEVHDNTYHNPNFATTNGDYNDLRARATTKEDIDLGNVVNERQTVAKQGGKNIWVQATAPTAIDVGDIWIETE